MTTDRTRKKERMNDVMKKKIIIFGATGETGVYLADYLQQKLSQDFDIFATGRRKTNYFDKYKIPYFSVDITNTQDFQQLPQIDVYAIVDLAGILPARMKGYQPEIYIQANILGTMNILEYAKSVNADRFMFMKSVSDYYGYLTGEDFFPADLPVKLRYTGDHTIYAISKCAAADICEHYHQTYGIKNFTFRLPNIYLYSPEKYYYVNGEKTPISYRYLIDKAINGEDIELWGDPTKGRDIVYVKDFAQIIYKAIISERNGGIYNVGSGKLTSMQEQIDGMIQVFSKPKATPKIIYCPEKKNCINYLMDISKTQEELGYIPQYDYISYLKDYKKEMESNRFDGYN